MEIHVVQPGDTLFRLSRQYNLPMERLIQDNQLPNPAQLVGLDYRKGSIAPGKDADLVVLDEELNVRETYVAGRLVYAGECE